MSFSTKLITRLSHFRIYTSDRFATLAHFFAQDLNESVTADSEEHHKNDQETSSSSALSRRRHRLSMDTIPYGDSTTPSSSFDNYSTHPVAKMLNLESKIPLTEIFDNLFHNIWHGRCYSNWDQPTNAEADDPTLCAFCFNSISAPMSSSEGNDDERTKSARMLCDVCEMRVFMVGLCTYPLCGPSGRKSKFTLHNLLIPSKPYTHVHPEAETYYNRVFPGQACMLGGLLHPQDVTLSNDHKNLCNCVYCSAVTYISLESQAYSSNKEDSTSYALIDRIIRFVRSRFSSGSLPEEWSYEHDQEMHDASRWKFVSVKGIAGSTCSLTWNSSHLGCVQLAKSLVSMICPTFATVCKLFH